MPQPPLPRQTSTPLRNQRPQARTGRARAVLAGLVLALAVGSWFAVGPAGGGGGPASDVTCAGPGCDAPGEGIGRVAVPTTGPTPCAYCNQDPARWRAFTSKAPPELGGKSAAVIEASCGTMLYGFHENERRPPASLTKIAAAMVTVEHAGLNEIVDIKVNGWDLAARDDSTIMGLEPGMRLPVDDLVHGMMLVSGNDAALALAGHLGGTSRFVDLMNQKAAQLGLSNTHFVTPDGRDAPGHYSTTLDMALMGRALLQYPYLNKVVNTKTYMPHWSGNQLSNNNEMIWAYADAVGVKTGYTETAELTIVTGIERNGRLLIASVFGAWHLYLDAVRLLNWAFENTTNTCR